jgi:hypothetical protein
MNRMDVGLVFTLVTTFLGGGFVTTLVTQRRQQREKLEERRALRDDGYRTELRHARANFIGAYSKLISTARTLSTHRGLEELALRLGTLESRFHREREIATELSTARLDAEIRLAELLQLESDGVVVEKLQELWVCVLGLDAPPSDEDSRVAYQRSLVESEKPLIQLIQALTGSLSPAQWDQRAKPKDLVLRKRDG